MAEEKKGKEKKKAARGSQGEPAHRDQKVPREEAKDDKVDKKEDAKAEEKKEEAKEESKAKKSDKKEEKKKEEKVDIVSETVYTVPLKAAYQTKPSYRRTGKAVKILLKYLKRHTKSDNIKIDGPLNKHIWKGGAGKPPRMVQIKAVKDSEGKITATLLQ